jgi:hypothetical protein
MTIVEILKVVAAVLTIGTGLLALVRPRSITQFIGLEAAGGRGVTELRAVFGAAFIALGIYPLIANAAIAYRMLGVMYLAIAAVRAPAMVVDRSPTRSNLISLATEIVLGAVLVW